MSHLWMSQVGCISMSRHKSECVMSQIWCAGTSKKNRRIVHMNESCHTNECVMSHVCVSHIARIIYPDCAYDFFSFFALVPSKKEKIGKPESRIWYMYFIRMSLFMYIHIHVHMFIHMYIYDTYIACEWVILHVWLSHEACNAYNWVTLDIWYTDTCVQRGASHLIDYPCHTLTYTHGQWQ